jgi:hypothetical protein
VGRLAAGSASGHPSRLASKKRANGRPAAGAFNPARLKARPLPYCVKAELCPRTGTHLRKGDQFAPKVFRITSQAMSAAVSFAHKLSSGARLSSATAMM